MGPAHRSRFRSLRRRHHDPRGSADPVDSECRSCAQGSGRVGSQSQARYCLRLTGGLPRAMSSCGRLHCSFRSARAFLPMAERSPMRRWSAQSGGFGPGRHIDAGHSKRAVWYASAKVAAIIVLRALATGSTPAAVVANALGSLGGPLHECRPGRARRAVANGSVVSTMHR